MRSFPPREGLRGMTGHMLQAAFQLAWPPDTIPGNGCPWAGMPPPPGCKSRREHTEARTPSPRETHSQNTQEHPNRTQGHHGMTDSRLSKGKSSEKLICFESKARLPSAPHQSASGQTSHLRFHSRGSRGFKSQGPGTGSPHR